MRKPAKTIYLCTVRAQHEFGKRVARHAFDTLARAETYGQERVDWATAAAQEVGDDIACYAYSVEPVEFQA